MPSQATNTDAQLILQLYELRRETEMQEYRDKLQSPYTLQIVEKLATKTEAGRERLQRMVKMQGADVFS
jgi:hypothetical protein